MAVVDEKLRSLIYKTTVRAQKMTAAKSHSKIFPTLTVAVL